MRRRIAVLFGLTLATSALVALNAIGPDLYIDRADDPAYRYPWEYPILSVAFGLVATALVAFRRASYRLTGTVIATAAAMFLSVRLLLTAMRSPMGHETLFFVMLGWTIGLLVYSGFTLAMWRFAASTSDTSDTEST